MRVRHVLAAAVVGLAAGVARAEDERILSGRIEDDAAFARALVDTDFPELAVRFLDVMVRANAKDSDALRADVRLQTARADARRTVDPVARRDAFIELLRSSKRFLDEFPATNYARDESIRLPDTCEELGDALLVAGPPDAFRDEADAIFAGVEGEWRRRLAASRAKPSPTEADVDAHYEALIHLERVVFLRSRLFPRASPRRLELDRRALETMDDFDVNSPVFDVSLLRRFLYSAICLGESGRPDAAVVAARPWFDEPPDSSWARSSMDLAKAYAEALLAAGDVKTALATAEEMIARDPKGPGARWGRELVSRIRGK